MTRPARRCAYGGTSGETGASTPASGPEDVALGPSRRAHDASVRAGSGRAYVALLAAYFAFGTVFQLKAWRMTQTDSSHSGGCW
jgi:hypothetical protein